MRGADCNLSPDEVDVRQLEGSKVLHFGSVSLTAGLSRSTTIFAARHAHQKGVLVSYDPNYRASLWKTQEEAQQWMRIPLPLVDLIKLSDEEVALMTDTNDPEEGSRRLEADGVRLVLITLGDKGSFYRWQGKTGLVPGVPTKVADTNGAGDTFLGAVLSRLVARGDQAPGGPDHPGVGGDPGLCQPRCLGDLLPQRSHPRHAHPGGNSVRRPLI